MSQPQHTEPAPAVCCSSPAENVDSQQDKESKEPTSRSSNDAVLHSGSDCAEDGVGAAAGDVDACAEGVSRPSCDGPKDGVHHRSPNAAQKPCGRKGIERKNFSKPVVDALQSWFYKNISHPYPNENQKEELASRLGISHSQVSYWFVNARKRLWKPYIKNKEDEDADADVDAVQLDGNTSFSRHLPASLPSFTQRLHDNMAALLGKFCHDQSCSLQSHADTEVQPSIHPAISAPQTAQIAQPAACAGQSQRITVFKSKVGRPPKKKPKLGQLNPHFIESVMTKPLPRFDEQPASLPLYDSPSAAANVVAPIAAAPQSRAHPLSDLNSYVQLAQMQNIEMQHRMSTLLALSHMQQPQPAVYSRPPPLALLDSAALHSLNYYQLLDSSLRVPRMLAPGVDAGVMGRVALPRLGSLLSLQQSAQLERYREVMTAVAATQDAGSAYMQQLRQIEQAQQQLINHLTASDKQSPSIGGAV